MAAVIITISILHIFTLIQSVEAVSESSVYSQSNYHNFFTDIFTGILTRLFPRNVQSLDQLDKSELRVLNQKRKQKQRLHNKFKKDILSMIAIKRRKDTEDDLLKYKYDKPPKINYQRNGSHLGKSVTKSFDFRHRSVIYHKKALVISFQKRYDSKYLV